MTTDTTPTTTATAVSQADKSTLPSMWSRTTVARVVVVSLSTSWAGGSASEATSVARLLVLEGS